MATLTIKIDSEDLAREVLTRLGYMSDVPDLVEVDEEAPREKKELTNKEVFAFLRAKGMTLESACACDPAFHDTL